MRIISGIHKGKRFTPPSGYKARPTTDFAKEAIFNILENHINLYNITVLDLFSGTGSISFEFASRGAGSITSVEMNPQHCNFIKSVAAKLELSQVHVVRNNVFDFLNICKLSYDIIYADPPYDIDRLETLPHKILSYPILNPGGILILEHSSKHTFSNTPGFLQEKKYGSVHFSLFSQPV